MPEPVTSSRRKTVGYIGSPGNLKDPAVLACLESLFKQLQARKYEIFVGPPNAQLREYG